MKNLCEYLQAADVVVQASLAEGGGMSPLEALACGTPVVATRVGGMALTLPGIAQLTPPRRREPRWPTHSSGCSQNATAAQHQALRGRDYVEATWSRDRAFARSCGGVEGGQWPTCVTPSAADTTHRSRSSRATSSSRGATRADSRRRLTLARELSRASASSTIGSGDGTFLALAMMADAPPAAAVGAELLDASIDDCRRALSAPSRA